MSKKPFYIVSYHIKVVNTLDIQYDRIFIWMLFLNLSSGPKPDLGPEPDLIQNQILSHDVRQRIHKEDIQTVTPLAEKNLHSQLRQGIRNIGSISASLCGGGYWRYLFSTIDTAQNKSGDPFKTIKITVCSLFAY